MERLRCVVAVSYTHLFKRRYESGVALSDDQHITDLKRLLHYRGNSDYRDEVNNLIKKYLKVRCIKDGKKVYVNPSGEKVFFSVNSEGMSIEQYYSCLLYTSRCV